MAEVREKYFKTKYRPADILLNVKAMIYINFKLQLTFINDNNLKLFRRNTSYHEKITQWNPVTSVWLKQNHLSCILSLRWGFQNRFTLDMLCSNILIILVLFFQIIWIVWDQISSKHQLSFFHLFLCQISPELLIRCSKPFYSWLAMLQSYQSPVKCRSRNVEEHFMHKANYHSYCHIPNLEFM